MSTRLTCVQKSSYDPTSFQIVPLLLHFKLYCLIFILPTPKSHYSCSFDWLHVLRIGVGVVFSWFYLWVDTELISRILSRPHVVPAPPLGHFVPLSPVGVCLPFLYGTERRWDRGSILVEFWSSPKRNTLFLFSGDLRPRVVQSHGPTKSVTPHTETERPHRRGNLVTWTKGFPFRNTLESVAPTPTRGSDFKVKGVTPRSPTKTTGPLHRRGDLGPRFIGPTTSVTLTSLLNGGSVEQGSVIPRCRRTDPMLYDGTYARTTLLPSRSPYFSTSPMPRDLVLCRIVTEIKVLPRRVIVEPGAARPVFSLGRDLIVSTHLRFVEGFDPSPGNS